MARQCVRSNHPKTDLRDNSLLGLNTFLCSWIVNFFLSNTTSTSVLRASGCALFAESQLCCQAQPNSHQRVCWWRCSRRPPSQHTGRRRRRSSTGATTIRLSALIKWDHWTYCIVILDAFRFHSRIVYSYVSVTYITLHRRGSLVPLEVPWHGLLQVNSSGISVLYKSELDCLYWSSFTCCSDHITIHVCIVGQLFPI